MANLVVTVTLVPAVEEMTFPRRSAIACCCAWYGKDAIVGTGVLFGLVHGPVLALPLLAAFGWGSRGSGPHRQRLPGDAAARALQRPRHPRGGGPLTAQGLSPSSSGCSSCSSPRRRPRSRPRRDGALDGAAERELPRGGGVVLLPLGLRRRDRRRAPSSTTSTRSRPLPRHGDDRRRQHSRRRDPYRVAFGAPARSLRLSGTVRSGSGRAAVRGARVEVSGPVGGR